MEPTKQTKLNSKLMTVIGLIAILALVLGWLAYNRSGEDVVPTVRKQTQETASNVAQKTEDFSETVQETTQEARMELEYQAYRTRLETRLIALRVDLQAEEITDETIQEIQNIRSDLAADYDNFSESARMELDDIDAELEQVEQDARESTADALLRLEALIALLRQDVATEDNTQ